MFIFVILLKSQESTPSSYVLIELARCRRASTQRSIAQLNLPCTKHRSKYVPIRVAITQAIKVGESQHAEHLSAARCVLKTNEEIEICPSTKNVQLFLQAAGDAWTACLYLVPISIRHNTLLSRTSTYFHDACMRRPGCFPGAWSSFLAFASRQFAPNCGAMSASFALFLSYFLVCERSGRKLPHPERSAVLVARTCIV